MSQETEEIKRRFQLQLEILAIDDLDSKVIEMLENECEDSNVQRAMYLTVCIQQQEFGHSPVNESLQDIPYQDLLKAQAKYLTQLKERLLDDCMSTDDELELDLQNAEEEASNANEKLNPKKRDKAKQRLQKLQNIIRIKKFILSTQEEILKPRNNMNNENIALQQLQDLNEAYLKDYDPITDIESEIATLKEDIADRKAKNKTKELQKLQGQFNQLQEIKLKLDQLQIEVINILESIECQSVQQAEHQLQQLNNKRSANLNKPKALQGIDDSIAQIQTLLALNNQIMAFRPKKQVILTLEEEKELSQLMDEEEIQTFENAKQDLIFKEEELAKAKPGTKKQKFLVETVQNIKRIIELFNKKYQQDSQLQEMIGLSKNEEQELSDLMSEEEIKTMEEAQQDLINNQGELTSYPEVKKGTKAYKELVEKVQRIKRIIELLIKKNIDIIYEPPRPIIQLEYFDVPQQAVNGNSTFEKLERYTYLMNLIKNMPECFLYNITKVLYLGQVIQSKVEDQVLNYYQLSTKTAFDNSLQQLNHQYKAEGNLDGQVNVNIQEAQAQAENITKVIDILEKVLFKYRKFNFQEFFQLLSLVDEASEKIRGKDIILLLGSTGCGKSTTVHYLCGSLLRNQPVKGLPHIEAYKILNKDLFKVKCSPFAKSETRNITPININLSELGKKDDQIVTLVDTPGAGDTESSEVDISNSLGILRGVKETQSVRVLILFSYKKFGARMEDFKNLIAFYQQMIDNAHEHIDAFTICFTHMPEDFTLEGICSKLQDCYNQLTPFEKQNEGLEKFMKKIVNKAINAKEGLESQVKILRPLDKQSLQLHINIQELKPITEPGQVFSQSIDPNAKFKVLQQFQQNAKIVIQVVKNGKGGLASYLIEEIYKFQQIFSRDQQFENTLQSLIQDLIKFSISNFDSGTKNIIKSFAENNVLSHEDMIQFKNSYLLAKQIDILYSTISPMNKEEIQKWIKSSQYIQILKYQMQNCKDRLNYIKDDIQSTIWSDFMKKFLAFDRFFDDERDFLGEQHDMRSFIKDLIDNIIKIYRDSVQEQTDCIIKSVKMMTLDNYNISPQQQEELKEEIPNIQCQQKDNIIQQIVSALKILYNSIEKLQDYPELMKSSSDSVENILSSLQNRAMVLRDIHLKDITNFTKFISEAKKSQGQEDRLDLEYMNLTPKQVEYTTQFMKFIKDFSDKFSSELIIPLKILQEFQDLSSKLSTSLRDLYEIYETKLLLVIKKEGVTKKEIRKSNEQIQQIRKIPFIQQNTAYSYNKIIYNFEELLQNRYEIVDKVIIEVGNNIKESGQILNLIRDGLNKIMELEGIFDESKDFFGTIKGQLEENINNLIEILNQEASQKNLDFQDIDEFKEVDIIFQKITELQVIGKIISNNVDCINIEEIKKKINEHFEDITKFIEYKQSIEENKEIENKNDNLLKKSECKRITNIIKYLSIMKSSSMLVKECGLSETLLTLFNEFKLLIESNSEKQKQYACIQLKKIEQYAGLNKFYMEESKQSISENQKELNNDHVETYIRNIVKQLSEILQFFKEIRNNHPEIHKLFDSSEDYEKEIKEQISTLYYNFQEKMLNLHAISLPLFKKNLFILTNLALLDPLAFDNNQDNFMKIHQDSLSKLNKQQENSLENAKSALINREYDMIQKILKDQYHIMSQGLDGGISQRIISDIQTECYKSIKGLVTSIDKKIKYIEQTNNYDLSNFKTTDDEIMEAQKILKCIEVRYLGINNHRELINLIKKFYEKLVSTSVNIIMKSDQDLKNKKYYDSHKKISDSLKIMKDIDFEISSDQEDILEKLKADASQYIKQLENQLEKIEGIIKSLGALYKKIEFKDYQNDKTKQILVDLARLSDEDVEIQICLDEMHNAILQKYKDQYYQIKANLKNKDKRYQDDLSKIRKLQDSLIFVDEYIKAEVTIILNQLKTEYQEQIKQDQNDILGLLERDAKHIDFSSLASSLQYTVKLDQKIKDKIIQKCKTMISVTQESLKQKEIKDIFHYQLINLYHIKRIEKYLPNRLLNDIDKICMRINTIFEYMCNDIKSLLNQMNSNNQQPIQQINIREQYISDLLHIDHINNTFKCFLFLRFDRTEVQSKILPQFDDKIMQIVVLGTDIFSNMVANFNKSVLEETYDYAIQTIITIRNNQKLLECFNDNFFTRNRIKNNKIDIFVESLYHLTQKGQIRQLKNNFKSRSEKLSLKILSFDELLQRQVIGQNQLIDDQYNYIIQKGVI